MWDLSTSVDNHFHLLGKMVKIVLIKKESSSLCVVYKPRAKSFLFIYIIPLYIYTVYNIDINMSKKQLGQFFTTNSDYILQRFEKFVKDKNVVDPFAGNQDLINWSRKNLHYPISS